MRFDPFACRLAPWFGAAALLSLATGLHVGFVVAPADAQQGKVYRIIFLHMPAVWMSMFIYLVMASYCALGLVLRTRLFSMMASALVPTGALLTAVALWTGALWGKSIWGTRWVWDVWLMSKLLLLLLYLGFIALESTTEEPLRAGRTCAVLTMAGVVNLPAIYFSVQWRSTLHQGVSISLTVAPPMAIMILLDMLLMALAYWMYSICVALIRMYYIIRERGDDNLNSITPV